MMMQDIYPSHLYNEYKPEAKPEAHDWVLIFHLGRMAEVMAKIEDEIVFPKVEDFDEKEMSNLQYLFAVDDEKYFLWMADEPETLEGFSFIGLWNLREKKALPKHRIYAVNTGKHLADWYRDFVFCGRCGTKTIHSKTERAKVCPSCGYTAYPRIMPAVIVGVTNGHSILITKYRTGFNHSALIAGFTEIGETMEETVSREVMEEAGIRVKNIRYYKSQPWGIANDMLLGYYCEVDGDDTIHMDGDELKYAEWVRYDEINFQPDNFSLTNEMMKHFAETKYAECENKQVDLS